jgi:hypothetical protein
VDTVPGRLAARRAVQQPLWLAAGIPAHAAAFPDRVRVPARARGLPHPRVLLNRRGKWKEQRGEDALDRRHCETWRFSGWRQKRVVTTTQPESILPPSVAHDVPQELGDFGVLVHGGWRRKSSLIFTSVEHMPLIQVRRMTDTLFLEFVLFIACIAAISVPIYLWMISSGADE